MMKALSVRQPWAWAIVHGIKTIENRSRPSRHRGPLVIHASKSRQNAGTDYSDLLPGLPAWDELDFGALIGVVDVVDCVPVEEVEDDPFAVGPWCWVLAKPRLIRAVGCNGQVSFFAVSEEVLLSPSLPHFTSSPAAEVVGYALHAR